MLLKYYLLSVEGQRRLRCVTCIENESESEDESSFLDEDNINDV